MSWQWLITSWRDINWDAAIAICTGLLAIFTAAMAWFTRRSIAESHVQYERTRAQSEQHHQDSFRPIVLLLPPFGIESSDRSNLVYFEPRASGGGNQHLCKIFGVLRNVGAGPALKVMLQLRAMGKSDYGFTRELTPLQAGETRSESDGGLRFWVQPTPGFNSADIALASAMSWELVIEYEDVFGNPFHTIHRKNPESPWTECGRGRSP